jgi:hypothetical protein
MRPDLASLLASQGKPDMGFRQGIVVSWDPLTGANQINVGGTVLDDLPTLAASTIALAVGDVVGLIRYQSTFFITGRISPAEGGALAIRSAAVKDQGTTTSTSYVDLSPPGPVVDAYIGQSRQCAVMMQVQINFVAPCTASMRFVVSGASTITTSSFPAVLRHFPASGTASVLTSVASTTVLTAADGLNPGLNTFSAQYARLETGTGGGVAAFAARSITVIPF